MGPKVPELCTSESHVPLRACTSFALSGRRLSKNQTPVATSTWLLRALLPKPPDASRGESRPRGAMKWKRHEQRRESRRRSFWFRRRWCLAVAALWFRRIRIKLLTPSVSWIQKSIKHVGSFPFFMFSLLCSTQTEFLLNGQCRASCFETLYQENRRVASWGQHWRSCNRR